MFSKEFLMKEKFEAMKTKNVAKKNVVSLALGDLNTASLGQGADVVLKVNGDVVSEDKFLELNIAKQLSSLTESIQAFKQRGNTEKVAALEMEVEYIKTTYFPPLSTEDTDKMVKEFKEKNPEAKMKEWMTYLRDNYFSRYDGAYASKAFNKK